MMSHEHIPLRQIGRIHSELKELAEAPLFYTEGAPDARIEIYPPYLDAFPGLKTGQEIIVLTWLHLADRNVLQVHPRGDQNNPLTSIFLTRSPDRPNPIGLHRCTILAVEIPYLIVGPIEALDGTPVLDMKIALDTRDE